MNPRRLLWIPILQASELPALGPGNSDSTSRQSRGQDGPRGRIDWASWLLAGPIRGADRERGALRNAARPMGAAGVDATDPPDPPTHELGNPPRPRGTQAPHDTGRKSLRAVFRDSVSHNFALNFSGGSRNKFLPVRWRCKGDAPSEHVRTAKGSQVRQSPPLCCEGAR